MDAEAKAKQQAERDARKRAREKRKRRRRTRRDEAKHAQPQPGRLLQWVTAADEGGLEALAQRLPRRDLRGEELARVQRVLQVTERMLQAAAEEAWKLLPRLESALELRAPASSDPGRPGSSVLQGSDGRGPVVEAASGGGPNGDDGKPSLAALARPPGLLPSSGGASPPPSRRRPLPPPPRPARLPTHLEGFTLERYAAYCVERDRHGPSAALDARYGLSGDDRGRVDAHFGATMAIDDDARSRWEQACERLRGAELP